MDLKGEQYLTVSATFYPEEDDEEEEIVEEAPTFVLFLIIILVVLAIVAIGGMYIVLPMKLTRLRCHHSH
ncbi:hypothetical protein ES703_109709 [subsurface metagenome]